MKSAINEHATAPLPAGEAGSTNVYCDLGYGNHEEMERKARLTTAIIRSLQARRLTPELAVQRLGCDQAQLSKLRRGQFRDIDEATMLDMLSRLGHDITITVGKASGRGRAGSMTLEIS